MKSMRRLVTAVTSCIALSATACSGTTNLGTTAVDITSIPQSSVPDQGQSGNCWLYATGAWIESLRWVDASDPTTHLSPAYWQYWDLYDQIVNDEVANAGNQVAFGGYWARAIDIVQRYGAMNLGAFVSDDAGGAVDAVNALNVALSSGVLAAPGAHQDRALVLQALNEAFQLSPAVVASMQTTFGADGTQTFDLGAQAADATITAPASVAVTTPANGNLVQTTLDQVLGARGDLVDSSVPRYWYRVGALAWNPAFPPTATTSLSATPGQFAKLPASRRTRATADADDAGAPIPDDAGDSDDADASASADDMTTFVRRIQHALNDDAPLPLGWFVDFEAVDADGRFHAFTGGDVPQSQTGGHETLLTDYEAINVPGYGTLPAGVPATYDERNAAMSGDVTFFRTKNSWGLEPDGWVESLAGYNDIDVAYLESTVTVCPDGSTDATECVTIAPQIIDVGFPPGY